MSLAEIDRFNTDAQRNPGIVFGGAAVSGMDDLVRTANSLGYDFSLDEVRELAIGKLEGALSEGDLEAMASVYSESAWGGTASSFTFVSVVAVVTSPVSAIVVGPVSIVVL